jgi:hypothetical protein
LSEYINSIVDEKYRLILKREQEFARYIALRVIEKPKLSVWMILIPIIFVQYFYSYKRFQSGMEGFAREFIYTRKVAMEAALSAIREGLGKEDAISGSDYQKNAGLSEKALIMHENQLREIALLFDHYEKLLRAEGDTYDSLVRHAYTDGTAYRLFLDQIREVEKVTNVSMKEAFGKEDLPGLIDRMESAVEETRTEELRRIFP